MTSRPFELYDPSSPPQGIDPKHVTEYQVGIRFQHLGKETNIEDNVRSKHWALVFAHQTGHFRNVDWTLQVELAKGDEFYIETKTRIYKDISRNDFYPLGTWTGSLNSITEIIKEHPMRWSTYSASWNNCQHYVATLLVYMEASISEKPYSLSTSTSLLPSIHSFEITHKTRYDNCMKVFKRNGATKLYHRYNLALQTATLVGLGTGAVATGASVAAATATTTTVTSIAVPASGIAGFFGATTTASIAVTAPAACATLGAIGLPIALMGTAVVGTICALESVEWKRKSTFEDPRRARSSRLDSFLLSA